MQATEVLMPGEEGERIRLRPEPQPRSARPLGAHVLRIASIVAATIVALTAEAAPTGEAGIDAGWRVVSAVVVVLCAGWAPAVAWMVAAAAATIAAGSIPLLVAGAAATAIAIVSFRLRPEDVGVGSVVGVLVFTVASNLSTAGPSGLATILAVALCAPMIAGGWRRGPWLWAMALRGAVVASVVGVVVVLGAVGWTALAARSHLVEGSEATRDALVALRSGDVEDARSSLDDAVVAFGRAERATTRPWLRPALAVPVVAQHVRVMETVASAGGGAGRSTAALVEVLARYDLDETDGLVDLEMIDELLPVVRRLAADLETASASLHTMLDAPWLIPPVRSAVAEGVDELDTGVTGLGRAATSLEILPDLSGANGARRHLVLFWTPAEARGAGGLFANWAVIEADEGRLALADAGRIEEFADALGRSGHRLTGPERYLARYGGYDPVGEPHDIGVSPDGSDVAAVAAELAEAALGTSFDTVITVDPRTVGAVLAATGPIEVAGVTLGAADVEEFLLVGQYERWIDDEEARVAFLEQLTFETVSRLVDGDVGLPALVEHLRPLFAEDRLTVNATDPELARSLETLGVTGSFPESSGDLAGFVVQNGGRNKIDAFLGRSISHRVTFDPATGSYEATSTVTLTNTAPDAGLAPAIIGSNDQGLPPGTNRALVTIYSPLPLRELRVDGRPRPVESVDEFGVRAHSTLVDIAAGGSVQVTAVFVGSMPAGLDALRLVVPVQPGAADTRVDLAVTVPAGWSVDGRRSWQWSTTTSADVDLVLPVASD